MLSGWDVDAAQLDLGAGAVGVEEDHQVKEGIPAMTIEGDGISRGNHSFASAFGNIPL
jgi:hypothetical protein